MQKESIKFADSLVFEGMTSIRALLAGCDSGVNDRKITEILFDKERFPKIKKEIGYLRAISESRGFKLIESDKETIDSITLGSSHGGIVAIATDRTLLPATSLTTIGEGSFLALIEGIEDPYNFGYAIRSLYAAGCDGIILGERNWMSAAGVVCRSSAGASELIPMYSGDAVSALTILKSQGYKVVCASEKGDYDLFACDMKKPLCLVVGGERRGMSKKVLDLADCLVRIPYGREFNASLSAASAATVFGYEILRQNSGEF